MGDRFNTRSFLALAFALALVALFYLSTRPPAPTIRPALFPPLQPLEPAARILAQSDWGPADEGANLSSEVPGQPFGASTRRLASFTTGPHDRRLSLVLDYAGVDLEKPARPDPRRVMVVLNISLRCPQAGGPCPEKQLDPFNRQKLFMMGEPENGSLVSRVVDLDGGPRELLVGHAVSRYDVAPNTPIVIDFSLSPGRGVHTRVLRTTLVTGDYLPPVAWQRPLGIDRLGLAGAAVALLLFAGLAWRLRGDDQDEGDPPRVLGGLLAVLGWAFAFAGLYGDLLYYLVVGIGVAFSGLLLCFGRAAALPLYGLVLAGAWIGSGLELGPAVKPMLMRVGLLSLIGVYLLSAGVRDRLRSSGTRS